MNAIIPHYIMRDNSLTASAKIVYGVLAGICDESGVCDIKPDEIAESTGRVKKSSEKHLKELIDRGYIKTTGDGDIVERLKSKKMRGLGYGRKVCEWCEVFTGVLHAHHYPIPKAQGGTETVDICPNCHHEYHYHDHVIELTAPPEEIQRYILLREGAS